MPVRVNRTASARRAAIAQAFALPAALMLGLIEAKADEAYVCEGGRIVTVRVGELDVMKRRDPCIAAYYGVKAEPVVAAATEPPLPGRKPVIAVSVVANSAATPAHPAPRPLPTASLTAATDIVTAPRVEQVVFKHAVVRPGREVAAPADGAKAPVDFRRVPILNAQPGAPTVFHHTR